MSRLDKIIVLLVEDNLGDARLVEIMLNEVQSNPVILNHVSSLAAAHDFLNSKEVDLVLLDLSLPDSQGLECINKIQLLNNSLAIIILTGLDDQDFAIKTMQQGAQDYLVKGEGDGHLMLRAIHYAIERKQIEQRLTKLAHFDSLTGLANREYFNITFTRAVEQADRRNQTLGLMFLDLDHFKEINDTLGHLMGDKLLVCIAERLKSCVRSIDFIARLGGDEFVIILDDIKTSKIATNIAEKILSALSNPVDLANTEVFISSSIGITLFPDDGDNVNDLLKHADVAMYKAKDLGRNNFQFYTSELNTKIIQAIDIKNDLRGAIGRNELTLFYQPKISIIDNKIVGAEALLRWQHPVRGMVPPNDFIPIAEQSGLIIDIGQWVIAEAIKQTKKWQQTLLPDFSMAINLSVKQFHNRDLIEFIETELGHSGVNASTIELEITESLLMEKSDQEQDILKELSEKGFKISMDDFGTGYSSLSYIKRFTIDVLKIDRSFISDVMSNPDDAEIVKAIIVMAHALKLTVVAEGVESEAQLDFLKQLKCDQSQGFLVSKPIPATEFEQLFREKNDE